MITDGLLTFHTHDGYVSFVIGKTLKQSRRRIKEVTVFLYYSKIGDFHITSVLKTD